MAPTDPLLSECLRQQKPIKEEEPEGLSWKGKPMHGMYHRQIEEVADIEKTYQWLTKAGLKDGTEAVLMAAQEQALSTRAIEARVYHTPGADCVEMPLRESSTSQCGRAWPALRTVDCRLASVGRVAPAGTLHGVVAPPNSRHGLPRVLRATAGTQPLVEGVFLTPRV
ncbi:hypothetical protein D4764_02G0002580 [Takifugu flavidus]|uniref:Uncharacterized protein n=1 Tax=Takifugu flavidus TaxID=433684 RepID=A0A5C6NNL3_9TELE|nr:hypothetical protein D4764_02G0002580 [Takifugu flavidus]